MNYKDAWIIYAFLIGIVLGIAIALLGGEKDNDD